MCVGHGAMQEVYSLDVGSVNSQGRKDGMCLFRPYLTFYYLENKRIIILSGSPIRLFKERFEVRNSL